MLANRQTISRKAWRIYGLLGFVSVAMLSAMLLLSRGGWQMSQHHVPLVDAVHEMRIQTALFHLWFEELVQGDKSVVADDVWTYLDHSEGYANAMLQGGGVNGYGIAPLDDPALLEKIGQAINAIHHLRAIGQRRLAEGDAAAGGSVLDQEFDAAFDQVSHLAVEVESELQVAIADQVEEFKRVVFALVFLMVTVSIGAAWLIYRYEQERRQAGEQIEALAFYDALTGLPNRSLFNDRLRQAMANSGRSGIYGALLFLDMDKFKPLNDTYGHHAGDMLLVEAARRIAVCVRKVDTVARFGGDEFVVVLGGLDLDKAESSRQACAIAKKICASLAAPYALQSREVFCAQAPIDFQCTSSCGVVLFVGDEVGAEALLDQADAAMYKAKDEGCNRFVLYEPAV